MFRPFLNSLMLGSLFFPFIAIAGSTVQWCLIHSYGQIVDPSCDVSTQSSPVEMNCPQNGSIPGKTYSSKALMSGSIKDAQIASVKVQYLDKQKKLAVMNIEYN
ncbi:type 1 fimbrial protein [Escherichia coli]|nr:type 1 fimbrial protein [Escherichia coli]